MEFVLTHPDKGTKSILLVFDGVPYEADNSHPWWQEIIYLALEDDPRVVDLFPQRPFQKPAEERQFVGPYDTPASLQDSYEASVAANIASLRVASSEPCACGCSCETKRSIGYIIIDDDGETD